VEQPHVDRVDALKFDRVVSAWYRRARQSQLSHYVVAARYSALSRRLGVPSVLLSAATGTALFATLKDGWATPTVQISLGCVSLLAAVLSALHTFLNYGQRADQHRAAASRYGAIRREMERYQAFPPAGPGSPAALSATLDALRGRLDEAAQLAPDVPPRLWRKAQADIEHTARPEGFKAEYWRDYLAESTEPTP
jgi:hypothetical protein